MEPAPHTRDLPDELLGQRLGRLRRSALRAWWMHNRVLVTAGAALAALILALWGFSESDDTEDAGVGGWADRVYRAVGFFRFSGVVNDLNWQLHVARVLAPLVIGYAAFQALVALFREQAQLISVRLFARRHVIVVGLGRRGLQLATALHEARVRVVVVDVEPANPSLGGCRARGIPVVVGDGRDPEVLSLARCDRALHLVACSATDATNLDVLAACTALAERRGGPPMTAHVLLETTSLRTRLQTLTVGAPEARRLRVDFAGLSELMARALVSSALGVWTPGASASTILVVAATETGRQAAIAVVRVAAGAGADVRLVLAGPEAEADAAAIFRDAPGVRSLATVDAVPCDPAAPDADRSIGSDADVAFVCHPDQAVGLAWGAAIADRIRGPVLVDVTDEGVLRSLDMVGVDVPGVYVVGAASRVLGPSLLLDTANEAIARARHDAYLRLERARGRGDDRNASLVPWDELPESLKESNRRFADSVGTKAAQLGGRVVPLAPDGAPPERLLLPDALVEELAQAEHARWARDLYADGWAATGGEKDAGAKLHPLLVDWERLDEEEREKDRDSVRRLARLLAAAGYALAFRSPNGQWTAAGDGHIVASRKGSVIP
jgi:voltage-gated potassium channel Kch